MAVNTYSFAKQSSLGLSPHFRVGEFRPRRGYLPDGDKIVINDELIVKLELLSDAVNNKAIHVNDGYRTPEYDIKLTGKAGQHSLGNAADIKVTGFTAYELAALAEIVGFTGIGIINSSSIHVDVRKGKSFFIENGLAAANVTTVSSFVANAKYIHCRKTTLSGIKRFEIVEIRNLLPTYLATHKPSYLMNAGFFANVAKPVFNLITGCWRASSDALYKWGIGQEHNGKITYGSVDLIDYRNFVSGYPVLLDSGTVPSMSYADEIKGLNPRTAIGYDDKYFYMVTIDGRSPGRPGMTLNALAAYMKYIGCNFAINLDGGGSSRFYEDADLVNLPCENRPVNSVLAIWK